jgi:hypothetical protein
LKTHRPWVYEGCSKLLNQMKQAKLLWLLNRSQINGDNLNNIMHEAGRQFTNRKEYPKDRTGQLAMNSKNKILETCIEE